jgi:predicted alpha-1,2-mannosidase
MFGLPLIDIIVIIAYFIVMVIIGLWSMRRVKNQEDFFLMGRRSGKILQTFAAFGQATSSEHAVGVTTTTWDDSLKFFRARAADGQWLDFPDNPNINREKYTYEGTPWQWRWFVPHDVEGLIGLIGGRDKFIADLDYFFSNDLYQAGNQPDIHAPFLFNYAGAPWLTQKWVSKILTQPMTQLYGSHDFFKEPIHDRIYKATPDGYLLQMDDDYGCMAAWYVLSSMGLFQVCPGQPVYQLSSPIFEKVTLYLDQTFYAGREFTIKARNLSGDNIYIQDAILNGNSYNKAWISHQDIVNGGELILQMGSEPNREWGSAQ